MVVDASVVVAALIDDGPAGRWAAGVMASAALAAPAHRQVEAASALRRLGAARSVGEDVATLAHADVLELRIQFYAYAPFGDRVWALRGALCTYDAAYVALAEALAAPLATLDGRLARAPGVACTILTPS